MNTRLKNILKNLAFLALGVALLWWAFRNMAMDEVISSLKSANYFWVVVAMLCGVIAHLSRALRWRQLIDSIGYETSVRTSFAAVMVGYLFNFVVPRMGEVSRCAVINQKDRIPLDKLIGTVITERLFDLIVIAFISAGIYLAQFDLINQFINNTLQSGPCVEPGTVPQEKSNLTMYLFLGGAVLLIVLVAVIYIKNPYNLKARIREFIANAWEGIKAILKLKKPVWFIFHTLNIWLMYYLMAYFIFFALPATSMLGVSAGFFVLLLGTLAIIVPIPGGIGTYHTFVAIGLTMYAIDCPDGKLYATISHGAQMVMIFVVGGLSLLYVTLDRRKSKKNANDAIEGTAE